MPIQTWGLALLSVSRSVAPGAGLSKLPNSQLSFLGWYLLCLLVLPLLYVAPYTGASMAIYARYLIERDNLIPRQESPTGRIVDQDYIDLGPQPD